MTKRKSYFSVSLGTKTLPAFPSNSVPSEIPSVSNSAARDQIVSKRIRTSSLLFGIGDRIDGLGLFQRSRSSELALQHRHVRHLAAVVVQSIRDVRGEKSNSR